VKVVDIGYVTVLYFFVAIVLAKALDFFNGKITKEEEQKKSKLFRALELTLILWYTGVLYYIVRNLVELVPSPLDGLFGYQHALLKELKTAGIFTFLFLYFQKGIKDKIQFFVDDFYL
jgi:amino acid transporter